LSGTLRISPSYRHLPIQAELCGDTHPEMRGQTRNQNTVFGGDPLPAFCAVR
jgi:hypothetical protein